jgi:hypothetical protein
MMNLFTILFACVSNRHFKHHLNAFKLISKGSNACYPCWKHSNLSFNIFLAHAFEHIVNRFFMFLEFWTVVYLRILPVSVVWAI